MKIPFGVKNAFKIFGIKSSLSAHIKIMKKGIIIVTGLILFLATDLLAKVPDWGDIVTQPPKGCRKAGYSCILKVVDGEAFWCQKTMRDRHHNARKTFRVTKRIRCTRRYAAERIQPPKLEGEE